MVYVDGMRARLGRMVMCHMLADTDDELHAMADRIGVARRWVQRDRYGLHYDIGLAKRALAVKNGAKEIDGIELGELLKARRIASRPQAEA